MSASEKRYFKRHYSSEKNLTTDLFDFINGMQEYNEEEVKNNFSDTKLAKNLKVYKVQLTDLLLKSLVSYYAKKSVKSRIRQGLEEIDILLEKQLYGVALSKCKKIKDLAQSKQELEYLIPIMDCEIRLLNFFKGDPEKDKQVQVSDVLEINDNIKSLYELKDLNYKLSDQNNRMGSDGIKINTKEAAENLLNTRLKETDEKESFHFQFYKNSSRAILYKMILKNGEKEFHYKKRNVELFDQHSNLIENNGSTYFAALYNYLVCCRVQKRYEELEEGLVKIKKLVKDHPSLGRNAIYIYYLETKHQYESNNFEKIRNEIEPVVLAHIKKYRQENEHLSVLSFIYFSLTNLILKDYHQVHFYLRRLFDRSKALNNNYLRLFDTIELMSHLETEDYDVANLLISTLKRRTRTQKSPSSFYTFLLKSFRDILKTEGEYRSNQIGNLVQQWDSFSSDEFYQLANEFFLEDWKNALQSGKLFTQYKTNQFHSSF